MRSSGEAETTAKACGVRIPERKSRPPIFSVGFWWRAGRALVADCDLKILGMEEVCGPEEAQGCSNLKGSR